MGERILVTGAGGFIGGRLTEVLQQSQGIEVRAGVRRWGSAARIGRFPVDIANCDLLAPDTIRTALDGVSGVVHCAVGDRDATVQGTENLLAAALEARVDRVVHISTIDVYGSATGAVDEKHARQSAGSEYGSMKLDAERVCERFVDRGLSVVILRPTLVYGPFSESWTIEWAQRLQARPWLLSETDCQGTCNLVYVDDLVTAMVLALRAEGVGGEAFNINGPDRPTWSAYFHALNGALGLPALQAQSTAASHASARVMDPVRKSAKLLLAHFENPIMALYQRSRIAKTVMRGAEGLIRKTPTMAEFNLLRKEVTFSTDKALAQLGYEPGFSMSEGIALSVAWLRHHGFAH